MGTNIVRYNTIEGDDGYGLADRPGNSQVYGNIFLGNAYSRCAGGTNVTVIYDHNVFPPGSSNCGTAAKSCTPRLADGTPLDKHRPASRLPPRRQRHLRTRRRQHHLPTPRPSTQQNRPQKQPHPQTQAPTNDDSPAPLLRSGGRSLRQTSTTSGKAQAHVDLIPVMVGLREEPLFAELLESAS